MGKKRPKPHPTPAQPPDTDALARSLDKRGLASDVILGRRPLPASTRDGRQ